MTQEEKELLLKDLCGRLTYEVQGITSEGVVSPLLTRGEADWDILTSLNYRIVKHGWKPYLRPLSSMTEEEILELYKIAYTTWYSDSLYYKYEEWITFRDSIQNNALCFKSSIWLSDANKVIDWLNAHHFDYRGLIDKGLALEALENMYTL